MSDHHLLGTTDAQVWAREFLRIFRGEAVGGPRVDEGLMLAWFANAIETGRTAGESKETAKAIAALPGALRMSEREIGELPWASVRSSNIVGFAYDPDTQVLYAHFAPATFYQYTDVPAEDVQALREASDDPDASVGRTFAERVKGQRECRRIDVTNR